MRDDIEKQIEAMNLPDEAIVIAETDIVIPDDLDILYKIEALLDGDNKGSLDNIIDKCRGGGK